MHYRSVNPATGEVLKTFAEHTDNQVMDALSAADRAFRSWAGRPFSERSKIIGRSAHILRVKMEELARLATLEMGKRIAESRGEVELAASIMQYFADNAEAFLAPKKLNSIMGDAHLEYSPLGVLLSIQPWNYPYYQLARFAAPHLMAGNTMLVKHAPGVPQCALAFEEVLLEAGIPDGVFLSDGEKLVNQVVLLVPPTSDQDPVRSLVVDLNLMLQRYIRAKIILGLLSFLFSSVALLSLGFPHWLALGVLAGILEFIPIAGWMMAATTITGFGVITHSHWI
jgi:hypothetical protein